MKRICTLILTLFMLVSTLAACTKASAPKITKEPLPVTLTMLSNWNEADTKLFADAIHEKLPHIILEYEACPIGALPYADEITRRVMHDAEADIFLTTDTNLWSSGKLLNLTDEEFVAKYNLSIMKTLSGDGSVYFLPNVGDVLCYIYNDQWLKELGLQAPQTIEELDAVFAEMSTAGKHPFIVPYSQMPTQYIKVMVSGYLSTPKGQQWMNDYNEGKTTMAQDEVWQRLWKRAEEMAQKGYLLPEDMVNSEPRRIVLFQEGRGFMTTFSSAQDSRLSDETKEQFQVLPLLGEKPENQMIYTAPSSYFALSNKLSLAENSNKRAAALEVLDFISTTSGQELLCGKNPLAISYLSDTTLPIHDKYSNLAEIIKKGAYTTLPMFERGVEKVIEDVFGKLVSGEITAADAIAACDTQNANYVESVVETPPIIGTATELFPWTFNQSRSEELAIIDFCLDSMRKAAKTDYAIELGTAFRGELFKGDITSSDIESIIRQDKKIYVVEVTGQQIWDIIAQGVIQKNYSWFIAPSGLRYSYQIADGDIPGKLLEITNEDGIPLDMQKSYTLAVSENQMIELADTVTFFGINSKELPFTLREAVTNNIKELGEISPKTDGRIQIVTTEK